MAGEAQRPRDRLLALVVVASQARARGALPAAHRARRCLTPEASCLDAPGTRQARSFYPASAAPSARPPARPPGSLPRCTRTRAPPASASATPSTSCSRNPVVLWSTTRRGSCPPVAALVQPEAPSQHRPHVVPAQVRVTAGLVDVLDGVAGVVRDELHPAAVGVEHLGAAGHEASLSGSCGGRTPARCTPSGQAPGHRVPSFRGRRRPSRRRRSPSPGARRRVLEADTRSLRTCVGIPATAASALRWSWASKSAARAAAPTHRAGGRQPS